MTELDEALLYARRSGVPVYQHQTVAEAYLARARDILAKHKETAR